MPALPKQVVQQQQEVEALEKQLFNPEPEPTAEPTPTDPPAPEPNAEAQPTRNQQEPTPVPAEDPTWEQRYKTLNGMFQAEVPRLQQQNKELVGQLQTMQAQIAELQKPKPTAQPVDEPLITDRDREAFGDDMIDLATRVTKQVIREQVSPLKAELAQRDEKIAKLEQMLQTTNGDVNTMTFEQRLYKAVPDFDAINTNPQWIGWLAEVDPFTGETRGAYANYVYNQGDVEKVKRVVDLWKAAQQPAPQVSQRQQELERQVQPTRSNATTLPQGKKTYTEAEASGLFDKVRKLNVNGKYD